MPPWILVLRLFSLLPDACLPACLPVMTGQLRYTRMFSWVLLCHREEQWGTYAHAQIHIINHPSPHTWCSSLANKSTDKGIFPRASTLPYCRTLSTARSSTPSYVCGQQQHRGMEDEIEIDRLNVRPPPRVFVFVCVRACFFPSKNRRTIPLERRARMLCADSQKQHIDTSTGDETDINIWIYTIYGALAFPRAPMEAYATFTGYSWETWAIPGIVCCNVAKTTNVINFCPINKLFWRLSMMRGCGL